MTEDYFEKTKGFGVLSTADDKGLVNSAVFSRPHIMEDGTYGFIMPERLTWANIEVNPNASFLFREEVSGYKGVRLQLKKARVIDDADVIEPYRRRTYSAADENRMKPLHLVCFELGRELPLIGQGSDS